MIITKRKAPGGSPWRFTIAQEVRPLWWEHEPLFVMRYELKPPPDQIIPLIVVLWPGTLTRPKVELRFWRGGLDAALTGNSAPYFTGRPTRPRSALSPFFPFGLFSRGGESICAVPERYCGEAPRSWIHDSFGKTISNLVEQSLPSECDDSRCYGGETKNECLDKPCSSQRGMINHQQRQHQQPVCQC